MYAHDPWIMDDIPAGKSKTCGSRIRWFVILVYFTASAASLCVQADGLLPAADQALVESVAGARGLDNDTCSGSGVETLTTETIDVRIDSITFPSDPADCWRFVLGATSDVDIMLVPFTADLDIRLSHSSQTVVAESTNAGTNNEDIIAFNLPPGTYFIEVFPKTTGATDYELVFEATSAPGSDNNDFCFGPGVITLATPSDSGNGNVGSAAPFDPRDCWRFDLTATSNVDVTLSGLSANLNINLLDSNEMLIASGVSVGGASPEFISVDNLPSGTYYIEVVPQGNAESNYTLDLSAEEVIISDGNDSCFDAGVVILPTPASVGDGSVGGGDPLDCWRFDLNKPSDVDINLSGLSDNLDLTLRNSGLMILASSQNGGSISEFIAQDNLPPGTYYIEVDPFGDAQSGYTLSLQTSDASDGNDTPGGPGVMELEPGDIISDSVGGGDPTDFWRLNLDEPARAAFFNVQISLRDLTDNLDLFLYAEGSPTPIASSTSSGSASETITMRGLTPGVYHIEIRPLLDAQSSYTLEIGAGIVLPALSNISYNGFVDEVIRPAFIQVATAEVVITAETLGLPDPQLSLKRISDSSTVAFNDDCDVADIAALIGRPLATPGEDACIVEVLEPGAYFFEVTGSGLKASGSILAGVTQPAGDDAALTNISYNGFVAAEGIRPAFILINSDRIVITAESFGLPDPQVALKRLSDESTVAFNDDCAVADIETVIGRPLTTALDACIVIDGLEPEAYFIEVSDVDGASGNALVGATQVPVQ